MVETKAFLYTFKKDNTKRVKKLKIVSRNDNQSFLLFLIPFLGLITEDFNNFLQNIFANINISDLCKCQVLFRNFFIGNIKLAHICKRHYKMLKYDLFSCITMNESLQFAKFKDIKNLLSHQFGQNIY